MIDLHLGDCLEVMAGMEPNSVDTIITDPPYGLTFMGKDWDHGIPGVHFWELALRVAKPGALLLAFGGTRTWHRLACALEDAGWEIRDTLMWIYGSGFPKSHDISKAIDKAAGAEREITGYRESIGYPDGDGVAMYRNRAKSNGTQVATGGMPPITAPATLLAQKWHGWGTALKPAWEPIILAMKPLDGTFAHNAETWGVAGLNIEGGRIGTTKNVPASPSHTPFANGASGFRPPDMSSDGWNALSGRWPANLILDEDAAKALDEQSGNVKGAVSNGRKGVPGLYQDAIGAATQTPSYSDTGGASRFFKVVKGDKWQSANIVESSSNLQSVLADSVLSLAAVGVRLEETQSRDSMHRFMSAMQNVSGQSDGNVIEAIQNIGPKFLQEFEDTSAALSNNHAKSAETQRLTDITTITRNLLKFVGSAEVVTSNGTSQNGVHGEADSQFATRFRYVAKASRAEREAGLEGMETKPTGHRENFRCTKCGHQLSSGTPCICESPEWETIPLRPARNHHPTVKPLQLMRYLCKLTATPTGGVVLDPFMGSGTTGIAAVYEGRSFVGIEKEAEYLDIARRRIAYAEQRAGLNLQDEALPLWAGEPTEMIE